MPLLSNVCRLTGFLALCIPVPNLAYAADNWTLAQALNAPATLKISGSQRIRYEALDGQFRPSARATQGVTNLRATLFAEYAAPAVRLGGELYDSRAYGGHADGVVTANDVNTFELVQAYVAKDFKAPFGPATSASAQAGRFTLNLGSRRLVAADDYRNTTNGYTGLRLDARTARGGTVTLIYTLPQIRLPDALPAVLDNKTGFDKETADLALWGGIATTPPIAPLTMLDASIFGLRERDQSGRPTRDRDLRTVSARVIRNPKAGQFDFEAEAIYQFGTISADLSPAARSLEVSASFLHLDLGYQFAGGWKPRLSAEYDRASGDDGKASYGRFDSLFGMRRADLAPSGVYSAIGRTNISTPALRLEFTPSTRTDGFIAYRGLWQASATDGFSTTGVRDATGRSGHYAGQQVEGRLRYWVIPNSLRLEANGVYLRKGGVLKTAPNAPRTGNTRYISLALTATF